MADRLGGFVQPGLRVEGGYLRKELGGSGSADFGKFPGLSSFAIHDALTTRMRLQEERLETEAALAISKDSSHAYTA